MPPPRASLALLGGKDELRRMKGGRGMMKGVNVSAKQRGETSPSEGWQRSTLNSQHSTSRVVEKIRKALERRFR